MAQNYPSQITSNTIYLSFSQFLPRALGVIITPLITRRLGPTSYGDLMLAHAFLTILLTLSDAGLEATIIREASQPPGETKLLTWNGFLLRIGLALVCFVSGYLMIGTLYNSTATAQLSQITLLALLASPMSIYRAIFWVQQKAKLLALLEIAGHLVNAMLVLSVLMWMRATAAQILAAQITAMFAGYSLYFIYGRRLVQQTIPHAPNWQVIKRLFHQTWPLTLTGMLSIIQAQTSRLMIGGILDSQNAGLYSIAFNLAATLHFFPAIYFLSVYPLLAAAHHNDHDRFQHLARSSFKLLLVTSLMISLTASMAGGSLIWLFAGEAFSGATPVFIILLWARVIEAPAIVLYYIILAARQQKLLPWIVLLNLAATIVLLFVLLPRQNLSGAGTAALLVNMLVLLVFSLLKTTRSYIWEWLKLAVRPIIACLGAALILLLWNPAGPAAWIMAPVLFGLTLFTIGGAEWRFPWKNPYLPQH